MGAVELFLAAVGLSMDAFAVSICKGLGMKSFNRKYAFIISCFFGGFQAFMPFVGWLVGVGFQDYIVSIDHWIAFVLLVFIGVKMLYDSITDNGMEVTVGFSFDYKELLFLGFATAIDALAFGITIAFLGCGVIKSCLIIGSVTFALSFLGVWIGNKFGGNLEKSSGIIGGLILIIIGIKILAEHLRLESLNIIL